MSERSRGNVPEAGMSIKDAAESGMRAYADIHGDCEHEILGLQDANRELQRRLEDAEALHLADETTIRQLERRLEAAMVSRHEDGGEG